MDSIIQQAAQCRLKLCSDLSNIRENDTVQSSQVGLDTSNY